MDCHLFDAGPLPESMLTFCQLNVSEQFKCNFNQTQQTVIQENAIESMVCNLAAILFLPQCTNPLHLSLVDYLSATPKMLFS